MNYKLQLLDAEADKALLEEAYDWRNTAPAWFRKCLDIWKETKEEYLASAKDELHFGVFEDDEMKAVIRLAQERPGVLIIHLSAKKGIEFEMLLAAGVKLRGELFARGVQSIYAWLPSRNRGIAKMIERGGFRETGLRIYKGNVRNKVVCFKHYILEASKLMKSTEFSFYLAPSSHGIGVFAAHEILPGTYLRLFGESSGAANVTKIRTKPDMPEMFRQYCIDRGDDLSGPQDFGCMEIGWYLNHSPSPNAYWKENAYYALRNILPKDEVVIDYNILGEPDEVKEPYYKVRNTESMENCSLTY